MDEDIRPIGFVEFFREFLKVSYYAKKIIASLIFLIIVFGIVISFVEHLDIWTGIYLGFISAFTVGFGDVTPYTPIGKFVCAFLLPITGMVLTGIVVSIALKSIEHLYSKKKS